MQDQQGRRVLSPPQIAARYGCNPDKIHNFIRANLLRAIDIASPGSTRPRYVVYEEDLLAFEESRTQKPQPKPSRRRRAVADDVVEFV